MLTSNISRIDNGLESVQYRNSQCLYQPKNNSLLNDHECIYWQILMPLMTNGVQLKSKILWIWLCRKAGFMCNDHRKFTIINVCDINRYHQSLGKKGLTQVRTNLKYELNV